MDVSRIPDSPTPIVGYRVWGIDRSGLLRSTASGFVSERPLWHPYQAFVASCLALSPCGDDIPCLAHGCGIHAYSTLDRALNWAKGMPWERAVVVGTVKLWGRVVEGRRGWRAQFAYPGAFSTVITRKRRYAVDANALAALTDLYGMAPADGLAHSA